MRHRRRLAGMQNNGTAHIAAVAARLMAEDGVDDVELAKRKAAHQLNLPEWIGLPTSQAVYDALRTQQAIFQDSEQHERITIMRAEALYWMELLAEFHPYLTGSVLDGTAGRYSMIDILLYPDSDKDVEIFLLNQGVEYKFAKTRNDRTSAVLQVLRNELVVNLVIYPSHDEWVVFRKHDGSIRERAHAENVRARMTIDAAFVSDANLPLKHGHTHSRKNLHMRFNLLSRRALFRNVMLTGLAAIALISGCSKFDNSQSALNGPQVTAKFFDAQFKDTAGKPVDLTTLRGKIVVINFWSTWCQPCVEEMPMFSEVQTAYKDKNVIFVGIAADQVDNVKAFLQKTPVNYPIAVGGQQAFELSQALGNRHDAVPFTLMINAKEGITSRHFGVYTRKDLEADIAKALK